MTFVEKRKPGPKTIKEGDPNCTHQEKIEGLIGTCCKCGRVREYPDLGVRDEVPFVRESRYHNHDDNSRGEIF